MKKLITFLLVIVGVNLFAADSNELWTNVSSSNARTSGEQAINTKKCRTLQLNLTGMKQLLMSAPFERTQDAKSRQTIVALPMPDGSFQRFSIVESPVYEPGLVVNYPEMKTWAGQGIDDPTATVQLDVTQWGFHSMILSGDGEIFIDPYNQQTTELYICYNKNDAVRSGVYSGCAYDDNDTWNKKQAEELRAIHDMHSTDVQRSSGDLLRTYRLALACTGEYAAVFGGTKAGALAAMITSSNRVNGVYEKELAIRLVLIANDTLLIYTNAGTDPYTNISNSATLTTNVTTCNTIIGAANYDIGHVFNTDGGGIAGLGVVCQNTLKGKGTTGLPNPVGDAFDIDFVAHEIGHQFGGSHTFNSVTGNCGGGNRSASSAYEPGSAITIMGYAGICGSDDLAAHSIPTMHTRSFDQMQDYTTFSSGSTCPVSTLTGNNAPVSGLTIFHYDIPLNTPFKLTGAGSDPDGDTITYSFEEYDLGAGGAWNAPVGDAPIFMSYVPHLATWRLFPKLANILANVNSRGELKPAYARVLNFRMTLRDNKSGGAGVTYDDSPIEVNVVNTTTPFAITSPNTIGISWPANSSQTITWNVSGTTAAPINTANVNIYLSTTGGTTYPFPILIASNVPNTGSYTFTVPNNQTSTARILVEASNNIFLDINDKNFAITAPVGIEEGIHNESISITPNPAQENMQFTMSGELRGRVEVRLTDASGRMVENKIYVKQQTGLVENIDISNLSKGVYIVSFISEKGTSNQRLVKN